MYVIIFWRSRPLVNPRCNLFDDTLSSFVTFQIDLCGFFIRIIASNSFSRISLSTRLVLTVGKPNFLYVRFICIVTWQYPKLWLRSSCKYLISAKTFLTVHFFVLGVLSRFYIVWNILAINASYVYSCVPVFILYLADISSSITF